MGALFIIGFELATLGVEPVLLHDTTGFFGPTGGVGPSCGNGHGPPGRRLEIARQKFEATRPIHDEGGVPHRVQVGTAPISLQLNRIAATVVGKTRMQRLVNVGDKMNHVFKCLQTIRVRPACAEDGCLSIDRSNDALALRAVAGRFEAATAVTREIDVMPGCIDSGPVVVGPTGDGAKRGTGLQTQEASDLGACFGA